MTGREQRPPPRFQYPLETSSWRRRFPMTLLCRVAMKLTSPPPWHTSEKPADLLLLGFLSLLSPRLKEEDAEVSLKTAEPLQNPLPDLAVLEVDCPPPFMRQPASSTLHQRLEEPAALETRRRHTAKECLGAPPRGRVPPEPTAGAPGGASSLSSMSAAMRLPSFAFAGPTLAASRGGAFGALPGRYAPCGLLGLHLSPFGPSVVLTTGTSRRVPKNPERCVRVPRVRPTPWKRFSRRRFLASSTRVATKSLKASRPLSMVQRPAASLEPLGSSAHA